MPFRVAIISGASRGIGRAIAEEFARTRTALALVARDESELQIVADSARAFGAPSVISIPADLSDPGAPANVVRQVIASHKQVDILVNCAGDTRRGDFLHLQDEDFRMGFEVKFHAAVRFCRAAWPHLEATSGCIVNIAGVTAHTPEPDFTIGGPVNSALINFTKALAKRARDSGIRINTICPGHIATGRLHKRIQTLSQSRKISLDEATEQLRTNLGIRRFGHAAEIARVASFLCSDQGAYVHGEAINVDGGATPGI